MSGVQGLRWLMAGLTIGGLLAHMAFRRSLHRARREVVANSCLHRGKRGTIEYAMRGAGPPVLVSHGSGGGYDQGLLIARVIGGSYWHISVSRFGYLRSTLPGDAGPAAQATAFADLLDYLGIKSSAIVAVSAGAPAAIEFARRYPDRCSGLILISGIVGSLPLASSFVFRLNQLAWQWDLVTWLMITAGRPLQWQLLGIPRRVRAHILKSEKSWVSQVYTAQFPASMRRTGLRNDWALMSCWDPQLADIDTRTLVLHAADDPFVPVDHARRAVTGISGAHAVIFQDGGHLLLGHHAEARRIVQKFLRTPPNPAHMKR